MQAIDINTAYVKLLMSLSRENQLDIFSKLAKAMKTKTNNDEDFFNLFGSFQFEKSAEEMIQEIRESRKFNRVLEPFN